MEYHTDSLFYLKNPTGFTNREFRC